jgi:radical SAM superfamily enzyme YgiQ (UPF0313 family)
MPSRILLLSANRCTVPDPVFPLGLAYLTEALHRAGHEVFWLDSLLEGERLAEKLAHCRPDFVGISLRNIDDVLVRKRETFFEGLPGLIELIRQQLGCPIILGGSGFSIFPEQLLKLADAEFGLVGEGEVGFPALITALENKTDYRTIPGLVFREGGRTILNPPVPGRFNLALNDVDFSASVTSHYLRATGTLNIQTQRGCAFRCNYCTYPLVEGRQHRRRPPELVADEFERLQRYGARYVFIVDSVFNSSARHVTETCEALIQRNLKLPWGCFLRPQGLTPQLVGLMRRAGLAQIEFGSDSFCDEVLAAYQKDFRFEDILYSSKLAREAGLEFCHYLIAGGPGETKATLEQGFANSQKLEDGVIMALVGMRIYPGTHLFNQAVAERLIDPDTDLLRPSYYLAPGLTADDIFALLQDFARRAPNWIVGDPVSGYEPFIARLRQRGVAGPLWSYLAAMQRLHAPTSSTDLQRR